MPSAPSDPSSVQIPAVRRPPAIVPTSAAIAGNQTRIESTCDVLALEEEVEGEAGDADDHQGGIDAQHPALGGADERRTSSHEPGRAADQDAVDEDPLEAVLREAPEPGAGAH